MSFHLEALLIAANTPLLVEKYKRIGIRNVLHSLTIFYSGMQVFKVSKRLPILTSSDYPTIVYLQCI